MALKIRPHVMLTLQVYKCSQPKKKGLCTPMWQTAATPTPVAKSSSMPQYGARIKVALPGRSLHFSNLIWSGGILSSWFSPLMLF